MKNTDVEYVSVGKVGSTYGVLGWVKVISFTEPSTNILQYKCWYLESRNGWTRIDITDSRKHGKNIIVKLANYDNPEQSRLLAGKTIAVLRSELPVLASGHYYWHDLEGLTVINHNGESLGEVIQVMETGANDVLIVKGKKEHAVPYLLNDVIVRVDLENKVIHVKWDVI
jgi:16S rRNA processing protein RimM